MGIGGGGAPTSKVKRLGWVGDGKGRLHTDRQINLVRFDSDSLRLLV